MKLHLTPAQLLPMWRQRAFPEPVAEQPGGLTPVYGIDLEQWLTARMTDWYLNLLDTAPLHLLAPVSATGGMASTILDDGTGHLIPPEGFRRLVQFRLQGWKRDATIVTDPDSPIARRQDSPYSRGGVHKPVVVVTPGGLRIYSPPKNAVTLRIEAMQMIADTMADDSLMHIDSAALATVKPII